MKTALLNKIAKNVAETMMGHYENHNVVTDGYEMGEEAGFSEDEIEAASELSLSDPDLRKAVIAKLTKELNNY